MWDFSNLFRLTTVHIVEIHPLTYIQRFWPGLAVAGFNTLGGRSFRATKPVIKNKHQLWPSQADLQLLVGRCSLGGIEYFYV